MTRHCKLPSPPRPFLRRVLAIGRPPASNFGAVTDTADAVVRVPLTTLLTGNVVSPSEIVQLVIKPSRWFILLNSARFAAVVIMAVLAVRLFMPLRFAPAALLQATVFLIAGRLMWSVVQWMGRYYLLTDLRLIRVCGVFDVNIQSCALRTVRSVRIYRPAGERLFNRGSLEIIGPHDVMYWQTMSRFKQIHDTVQIAVAKSKQNGCSK